MISESLLLEYGARKLNYEKGDVLFREGDTARYFYQISSGEVKMNNFNDDGKEFIQSIFKNGDSFAEPPLFIDCTYPANAEALSKCEVYILKKQRFTDLLLNNPQVHLHITATLASRLYYKSIMATEISSHDAEHRILTLLDYFKSSAHNIVAGQRYKVDITRQQIADLTGLRVETVIRAIKTLEKQGELVIDNHKVLR